MSIKAVLFDFGGVFTVSPFGAVEELARERAIDPLLLAELVFGPYHLDTDHPWHQLERGEITLEATRESILQHAREKGQELDLWDVLGRMAQAHAGGLVVNAPVIQLLKDVKQAGYSTAIVTNNVKEFSTAWQSLLPMEQVDLVVDSAFAGVRKPDPAIYQLTLQQLTKQRGIALRPEECIFLDDVESNVRSAEALGIQGIVVTPDPDETVNRVWKRLKG